MSSLGNQLLKTVKKRTNRFLTPEMRSTLVTSHQVRCVCAGTHPAWSECLLWTRCWSASAGSLTCQLLRLRLTPGGTLVRVPLLPLCQHLEAAHDVAGSNKLTRFKNNLPSFQWPLHSFSEGSNPILQRLTCYQHMCAIVLLPLSVRHC